MLIDIFSYDDYRLYLQDKLGSFPNNGRGMKSKLAAAIGCQKSFFSHVLSEKCDLSLEQVEKLNHFFTHSNEEAQFFILLLLFNRAGTTDLKKRFRSELDNILRKREDLKNRRNNTKRISNAAKERYYSSWLYQAVRIGIDLPGCDSLEGIAEKLNVPKVRALKVIEFLIENNLVEQKGDRYFCTSKDIFLAKDSPMFQKYHYNWRIKAMTALEDRLDKNLHYSACFTISEKDAAAVRKMILDFIEKLGKNVANSQQEKLHSIGIDMFEL